MKKLFFLVLMLISSTISAFSQLNTETVYLKNGSVIKGEIVEYQPNKLVKIATSDNNFFVCNIEDIDKITRETSSVDKKNTSTSDYVTPQKGYRFFIAADQMTGDLTGFKFTTTHGAQLNNKIFLGGGLGFCVAEDGKSWETYLSIPFYADFRYDILDKKITPFIGARAGVAFAIEGITGFYGNLSFGGRFKRFSISMGVETLKGSDLYYKFDNEDYYGTYVEIPEPYRAFSFVTRFAFEF